MLYFIFCCHLYVSFSRYNTLVGEERADFLLSITHNNVPHLFTLLIVQYFGQRPFSRRNMYFKSHYIFTVHHFLLVYQSNITSSWTSHHDIATCFPP